MAAPLLIFGVLGIAYIVLVVAALGSIIGSRNYTPGLKALWALAVFAFPILGSIVWFLVGRDSHG